MKKRVLIINLGWEQQPLLTRLRKMDIELYAVHGNDREDKGFSPDKIHYCDYRDLESILNFTRQTDFDAVISDQCDYSAFAQSVVATRLGLPGPTIIQQQISVNKLVQREKSRLAGIDIPQFFPCYCFEEVTEAARTLGYPLILKPTDNRGSFGVNKVSGSDALEKAYLDALANSHSRIVLAEEFIKGVHITVDGYAFPGQGPVSLSLATKKMLGTHRQVAMDILYPGELPSPLYTRAMSINEDVNKKLGYTFGMLHSEYMVTKDDRVVLIEAANRGGGVFTSELIVPAVCGIDLMDQYISDCLGGTKSLYPGRIAANQVILKFVSFEPGKIKTIKGLEKLAGHPDVLACRLSVAEGDTIEPVLTDANRHGFMILKGTGNIRQTAEELFKTIDIEYC